MKGIADIVKRALGSGVIKAVNVDQIDTAPGYSTEVLALHGFEKRHLKWMEKQGLVLRGRLPTNRGEVVRWVFLMPSNAETA